MVARGQPMPEEQKKLMADGREAARERTRIVGYPIGCIVRVKHPRDKLHDGQEGTVAEHNMGEVGVRFGTSSGAAVWYLPAHLERVPKIRDRAVRIVR